MDNTEAEFRRQLLENLRRVGDRIAAACERARRPRGSVQLVAVTKSVGLDIVRALLEMGVVDLGENRPQELCRRADLVSQLRAECPPQRRLHAPRWHLIGRLQRNKVGSLMDRTALIHSVDTLRLAEDIHKRADPARAVHLLIEVNAGEEPQKGGVPLRAGPCLAEQVASLPNVVLRGLMSMAPLGADETRLRNVFGRVRELFDEMRHDYRVGPAFDTLSMGMSGDFELAVECGATLVRIGSALFSGLEAPTEPRQHVESSPPARYHECSPSEPKQG